MTRMKIILLLVLTAICSLALGAAAATRFTGAFLSTATDSRFIADANIYLTALEKLGAGDPAAASQVLRQQLNAAMLGLNSDFNSLSIAQQKQYSEIRKRRAQLDLTASGHAKQP